MTSARHLVTGEFPPDSGGVADYTAAVARALAAAGEDVHVWCGGRDPIAVAEDGITVHRTLGAFDREGLAAADAQLQQLPGSKRLLVQWVPHAYGRRSLNLAFCRWARRRVRRHGDRLEVMVHEPFLPFGGNVRQVAAAAVQRLMARVLLGAASRVWVATPAWEPLCRRYARGVPFEWTPVPSGIPVTADTAAVLEVRRQLAATPDVVLVGSFGQFAATQQSAIAESAMALDAAGRPGVLLLIGNGSEGARASIVARYPDLSTPIHATGLVPAPGVSRYLRACDLLVEPYADGVCGRRSSAAAALAHGCPMVTTDGRFTEPLWRESAAVRLVPAGEPQRLARAVVELAHDAAERSRLARRAREVYDAHFHVRHTVAALQAASQA